MMHLTYEEQCLIAGFLENGSIETIGLLLQELVDCKCDDELGYALVAQSIRKISRIPIETSVKSLDLSNACYSTDFAVSEF